MKLEVCNKTKYERTEKNSRNRNKNHLLSICVSNVIKLHTHTHPVDFSAKKRIERKVPLTTLTSFRSVLAFISPTKASVDFSSPFRIFFPRKSPRTANEQKAVAKFAELHKCDFVVECFFIVFIKIGGGDFDFFSLLSAIALGCVSLLLYTNITVVVSKLNKVCSRAAEANKTERKNPNDAVKYTTVFTKLSSTNDPLPLENFLSHTILCGFLLPIDIFWNRLLCGFECKT